MSTEADPKTRLKVFGVGYLDRDTERTRLQIFQGQYPRGYALCLFTSWHSGEILKYWPRFGGDFFEGVHGSGEVEWLAPRQADPLALTASSLKAGSSPALFLVPPPSLIRPA